MIFATHSHESAMGVHVFPILNPAPTSLPIPFLWVIPVRQPQASCIVHLTWTGDSFHIWYYICFNAILPNHPTLSLFCRVQKTVLYISVSFAVSYTGFLLFKCSHCLLPLLSEHSESQLWPQRWKPHPEDGGTERKSPGHCWKHVTHNATLGCFLQISFYVSNIKPV